MAEERLAPLFVKDPIRRVHAEWHESRRERDEAGESTFRPRE